MPRYCFHLPSKDQSVSDGEGVDMPDPTTAQGAADKVAAVITQLRGRRAAAHGRRSAGTDVGQPFRAAHD